MNSMKEMNQTDEVFEVTQDREPEGVVGGGSIASQYQSVGDPQLKQELMQIQNLLAMHRLDSQLSNYE